MYLGEVDLFVVFLALGVAVLLYALAFLSSIHNATTD